MARLSNSHPFAEIPPLGTPVTHVALADSLCPLLAGTASLTDAMAEASREGVLTAEELHPGLILLAGLLGLAAEVLERWNHDDDAAHAAEKAKKR